MTRCRCGWVDRDGFEVALQRVEEAQGVIRAVLGIFFTEVLMACNCSDEPPRQRVYCRVELVLDVATAEARFSLLSE